MARSGSGKWNTILGGSLMIFVTVGTQLAFNRLISTVDYWASKNPQQTVIAQIGDTDYIPNHIEYKRTLPRYDFDQYILDSDLIVSHAGIGTILTAIEYCKPIIVMPRQASLAEHRNDHQLATVEKFHNKKSLRIAMTEQDMLESLNRFNEFQPAMDQEIKTRELLIQNLQNYINV
jgi:UDP-N-acetylglucosamine transferase subunit ALG13